jgi:hypothetical protein
MMQLMQSYEMDDGVIGVDDLGRWPPDSEAFGFLEAISSARSVEALMKVCTFLHYRSFYQPDICSAPVCGQKTPTRRTSRAGSPGPNRDKDILFPQSLIRRCNVQYYVLPVLYEFIGIASRDWYVRSVAYWKTPKSRHVYARYSPDQSHEDGYE